MHLMKNIIQSTIQNLTLKFKFEEENKLSRKFVENVIVLTCYQNDVTEEQCQAVRIELQQRNLYENESNLAGLLKTFEREMGIQLLYDSSTVFQVRSVKRL